jgi:hypothetical protein
MAKPLDIQRLPTGLLDLLGLKGSGKTPVELNEKVSATLADCVDYYLVNRRTIITGNSAIAMTGLGNFAATGVLVPATEIWFVYACSCRLVGATAPATALSFWGTYTNPTATGFPIAATPIIAVGASDNGGRSTIYERPALFGPGTQWGISTGAATGVPGANGQIILDVARLSL